MLLSIKACSNDDENDHQKDDESDNDDKIGEYLSQLVWIFILTIYVYQALDEKRRKLERNMHLYYLSVLVWTTNIL